jgi:hypothetical protein
MFERQPEVGRKLLGLLLLAIAADLFVWDESQNRLYRFPIAAGLPAEITGMA